MASSTGRCDSQVEQAEQNRRRDVVGKVAGDANRPVDIRRGSAAAMSMSSTSPPTIDALAGSLGARPAIEIAVDFDGDQSATPSARVAASESPARTDLEKHIIGERARSPRRPCRPRRARGNAVRSAFACDASCPAIAGGSYRRSFAAGPLRFTPLRDTPSDSNRSPRAPRTGRRAASACRCGGRGESACRRLSSTRPAAARCRAAARPRRDRRTSRCQSDSPRAARGDRPAGRERRAHGPSTTLAVLRPTPGSSTSASIVVGTSPP